MGALLALGVATGLIGFVAFMFWLYANDFVATGYIGMNPVGIARLPDGSVKVILNALMAFRWDGDYRLSFQDGGKVTINWYNQPIGPRERVTRHLDAVAGLLFNSRPEVMEISTVGQLAENIASRTWRRPIQALTTQRRITAPAEQKLLPAPRKKESIPSDAREAYFAQRRARREERQEKRAKREVIDVSPTEVKHVNSPLFTGGKALCPKCVIVLHETAKDGKRTYSCSGCLYKWTS